ncbi:MAG: hypothetical protein K2J95_12505 [Lachnospiraceae bacterium]|nr:hypothetical protein [Lachnospiraceae bacterium]
MEERNNTFTILSLIFGILTFLTLLSVIFPFFFGSLSIIFAVLSKGSSLKMNSLAKTAVALSLSGIILITALVGGTTYRLMTDEEYRAAVSAEFERINGITLEEYMDLLEEVYKTGEIPDEWSEQLERMGY